MFKLYVDLKNKNYSVKKGIEVRARSDQKLLKNGEIPENNRGDGYQLLYNDDNTGTAQIEGWKGFDKRNSKKDSQQQDRAIHANLDPTFSNLSPDQQQLVLRRAISAIQEKIKANEEITKSGSTFIAYVRNPKTGVVYTLNVGDSVAYKVSLKSDAPAILLNHQRHTPKSTHRDGQGYLSYEYSRVEAAIEDSKKTPESKAAAKKYLNDHHRLTSGLNVSRSIEKKKCCGLSTECEIDRSIVTEDDILILFSDGIDPLTAQEIADLTRKHQNKTPDEIARILLTEALKKGSKDNISVTVIKKPKSNANGVQPIIFDGIFDGHGGAEVAQYIADHIIETINAEINKVVPDQQPQIDNAAQNQQPILTLKQLPNTVVRDVYATENLDTAIREALRNPNYFIEIPENSPLRDREEKDIPTEWIWMFQQRLNHWPKGNANFNWQDALQQQRVILQLCAVIPVLARKLEINNAAEKLGIINEIKDIEIHNLLENNVEDFKTKVKKIFPSKLHVPISAILTPNCRNTITDDEVTEFANQLVADAKFVLKNAVLEKSINTAVPKILGYYSNKLSDLFPKDEPLLNTSVKYQSLSKIYNAKEQDPKKDLKFIDKYSFGLTGEELHIILRAKHPTVLTEALKPPGFFERIGRWVYHLFSDKQNTREKVQTFYSDLQAHAKKILKKIENPNDIFLDKDLSADIVLEILKDLQENLAIVVHQLLQRYPNNSVLITTMKDYFQQNQNNEKSKNLLLCDQKTLGFLAAEEQPKLDLNLADATKQSKLESHLDDSIKEFQNKALKLEKTAALNDFFKLGAEMLKKIKDTSFNKINRNDFVTYFNFDNEQGKPKFAKFCRTFIAEKAKEFKYYFLDEKNNPKNHSWFNHYKHELFQSYVASAFQITLQGHSDINKAVEKLLKNEPDILRAALRKVSPDSESAKEKTAHRPATVKTMHPLLGRNPARFNYSSPNNCSATTNLDQLYEESHLTMVR